MPYSTGPDGKARSPRGVRVNRGLCLDGIAWNWTSGYIVFNLGGAKYYYPEQPLASDSVFYDFVGHYDPGFVWNTLKNWGRPGDRFLREEPKNYGEADIWFYAGPPKYMISMDPPT